VRVRGNIQKRKRAKFHELSWLSFCLSVCMSVVYVFVCLSVTACLPCVIRTSFSCRANSRCVTKRQIESNTLNKGFMTGKLQLCFKNGQTDRQAGSSTEQIGRHMYRQDRHIDRSKQTDTNRKTDIQTDIYTHTQSKERRKIRSRERQTKDTLCLAPFISLHFYWSLLVCIVL
jgi:hypothetical protein